MYNVSLYIPNYTKLAFNGLKMIQNDSFSANQTGDVWHVKYNQVHEADMSGDVSVRLRCRVLIAGRLLRLHGALWRGDLGRRVRVAQMSCAHRRSATSATWRSATRRSRATCWWTSGRRCSASQWRWASSSPSPPASRSSSSRVAPPSTPCSPPGWATGRVRPVHAGVVSTAVRRCGHCGVASSNPNSTISARSCVCT